MRLISFLLLLCLFCACSSNDKGKQQVKFKTKRESISRLHNQYLFTPEPPEKALPPAYPWENGSVGNLPKITKEYFRCKGSSLNPPTTMRQKEELVRIFDCGGSEKHGLPLKDNKEFIYAILLDLVNYIQMKTGKRIVITSGHRCPEHNTYVNASPENRYSKHMLGAEVSFYVQGLEDRPEFIVKLLQGYYLESAKYKGQKDFEEFKRYEKMDTDVSTQPWYNKEVFIKLHKKKEGRDFDNRHPYAYISIQVRYDYDLNEKVVFTWDKAHNNYFRK